LRKVVTDAVRLVLGHQRGAVAGESVADQLELGELGARREPRVVVLETFDQRTPPATTSR
jgi:hypothetical protein